MTFSVMCRQGNALKYLLKFMKHCSEHFEFETHIQKGKRYHAVYANIMIGDDGVFVLLDDMPDIELGSLVFMNVSDFIAYRLNDFKIPHGHVGALLWNLKIQRIAKAIGEIRIGEIRI